MAFRPQHTHTHTSLLIIALIMPLLVPSFSSSVANVIGNLPDTEELDNKKITIYIYKCMCYLYSVCLEHRA